MSQEKKALDFLGREITVGATIVYPVRAGSSMWLQRMQVSQVVPTADSHRLVVFDPQSSTATRRSHSVKNLHTVVVVEPPAAEAKAA
jgi:hypothetical protein